MRPGFGQAGRKVQLLTNHYVLNMSLGMVYQYDVAIVPLMRNKNGDPGNFDNDGFMDVCGVEPRGVKSVMHVRV